MTMLVLDTDTLVLLRAGHAAVAQRFLACSPTELAITVITVEEQLSGWYALLRRARNAKQISHAYFRLIDSVRFVNQFSILSYSEAEIARFESLKRMKLGVKAMDLRIAAIVLEQGGTLNTRNRADFARIPGLMIDDWSLP
jgi:tRNA(fMet)-specific endonuclease VapC